MRALVTSFEPYGGRGLNPAAEVANRLDGDEVRGAAVIGRSFPVSYESLRANVERAIAEVDPVLVIGFGPWPGQPMIRLERVALDVADFEIPDNDGIVLGDRAILPLRYVTQWNSTIIVKKISCQVLPVADTDSC